MGCGASSIEGDGERASRPAAENNKSAQQQIQELSIPDVTWEKDQSWSDWMCHMENGATEAGRHDEFLAKYKEIMFHGAMQHLAEMYPDCARAETIGSMGEDNRMFSVPSMTCLVSDASSTEAMHAFALVVAKPPQGRLEPGAELDSFEMNDAKGVILTQVALMRDKGTNVKHTLVNVFIGADKVTCRFDASAKTPTVTQCQVPRQKEELKALKGIVKDTRKAPQAFRGMFAPRWFTQAVRDADREYAGSTVWDEGHLPLVLPTGREYAEPNRLLVTRVYENMAEDPDETCFKLTPPPFPGTELDESDSVKILRRTNPSKEPGGIFRIALIVGISQDVTWPEFGDYAKSSPFKAGHLAIQEYAKKLHAQGILERCELWVYMGTDVAKFQFVGDPIAITLDAIRTRQLPTPGELQIAANAKVKERGDTSLPTDDGSLGKGFNLRVEPQRRNQLVGPESQYQAIKQHVMDKSQGKTPEQLNAQAIAIAPLAARTILELNFPGCEISDEGPFPATLPDGTETTIEDTRLVVARDPKQEPKSIVAAINVVPCPAGRDSEPGIFSTKSWLGTPEMKLADERLLELLKKRHAQGLVSESDCMAQTMMVKDATVYKFVDGDRFEDYGDARMAQFIWG